jgi:hypothetical protein
MLWEMIVEVIMSEKVHKERLSNSEWFKSYGCLNLLRVQLPSPSQYITLNERTPFKPR